jgi:predicted transcriptional regulator
MNPNTILLSVRPRYAKKILSGEKTVELRRVRPRVTTGDCVIMYVSSPTREISTLLLVEEILESSPTALWKAVGSCTGVTKQEYWQYFAGAHSAVGIRVRVVEKLPAPLSLDDLRQVAPGFSPPQSYRYFDGLASELRALLASKCRAPLAREPVSTSFRSLAPHGA